MVVVPHRIIAASLLSLSFSALADDATTWGWASALPARKNPIPGSTANTRRCRYCISKTVISAF